MVQLTFSLLFLLLVTGVFGFAGVAAGLEAVEKTVFPKNKRLLRNARIRALSSP